MQMVARFRDESTSSTVPWGYKRTLFKNGAASTVLNVGGNYVAFSESKIMSDILTSNYFYLLRNKKPLPMNGCVINKSTDEVFTTTIDLNSPTVSNRFYNYAGDLNLSGKMGLLDVEAADMEQVIDAVDRTTLQAYANVNSTIIDVGILFGGELKESMNMVRNGAKQLANVRRKVQAMTQFLEDASVSKYKKTKAFFDRASDYWMEIRMGWRPLVGTVDDLAQAAAYYRFTPQWKSFYAKEALVLPTNTDERQVISMLAPCYSGTCRRIARYDVIIRAGVFARTTVDSYPDTFGGNVYRLPTVLWELTPLSWVADYFLNIGTAIAAYTPDTQWWPRANWASTRVVKVQMSEWKSISGTAGYTGRIYGGGRILKTEIYNRFNSVAKPTIMRAGQLGLSQSIDTLIVGKQQISKAVRAFNKARRAAGWGGPRR
jgi:hypothetical protein